MRWLVALVLATGCLGRGGGRICPTTPEVTTAPNGGGKSDGNTACRTEK